MRVKRVVTVALMAAAIAVTGNAQAAKRVKKNKAEATSSKHHVVRAKAHRVRHMTRVRNYQSPRLVNEDGSLNLASAAALIIDQESDNTLFAKNADDRRAIASITKLMTAMVTLDGGQSLDEPITISESDIDMLRGSSSRLRVGVTLSRREMLHLALMSSENRAASALARYYPGGVPAFVSAMNRKATEIGMSNSTFMDSTGLNGGNMSTAKDLARMVKTAYNYPLIRELSTSDSYDIADRYRRVAFHNTNALIRSKDWQIGLSKTGYINEAGRCLVMQASIGNHPVIIVLLDSWGKYTRTADAIRIKRWIENGKLIASKTASVRS